MQFSPSAGPLRQRNGDVKGLLSPTRRRWQTIFIVLATILSAVVLGSRAEILETLLPLRSFSLQAPFIDEQLGNRWWDFGGSTIIEVNTWVRLTPDVSSKSGWIYSKLPFTSSSWEVEFEFQVHGAGKSIAGDGFAFWYTKDRAEVGPVFGNKDNFEGLGVFFDTYANSRERVSHPYVMAMVGDGKTSYDNSKDGKPNEVGGCPADFRGKEWPTRAKIRYVRDHYLEVHLDIRGESTWELCFRADQVKLPTVGYLGFSALTGDISDTHDILSVNTNGIVVNNVPSPDGKNKQQPGGQLPLNRSPFNKAGTGGGMSWWTIFFILLGFAAVGGIAFAVIANNSKSKRSKRF